MIVHELQRKYQLKILLDISGLKKSTYYYTLSKNNKDLKNDEIMNTIIDVYHTHKRRYGYHRIALELINRGYIINHKKVKRLMSIMGIYAITPKSKYKSYKGDMDRVVNIYCLIKLLIKKITDSKL